MDSPRLLITHRWPEAVETKLRARYDVTLRTDERSLTRDELAAAVNMFDAICPTISDRIDGEMLASPDRRVKILANYGAGYEHIDLAAAKAAGIVVTNTPDVLTDATADLAILLMLMTSRRAVEGESLVRQQQWRWAPTFLLGQSLTGKTLGVLGFGRIGRATAVRAHRAFGMKILYNSRNRADAALEQECDAQYVASVEELVAASDIVSLHCPSTPGNHHLVNTSLLQAMKPNAILINTARGSLVNERDLADALKAGTIAAAGLDVYENEPGVSAELLAAPNTVLLPHLGSATIETRTAMGLRAAHNLDMFFAGQEPPDRVA